MGLLHTYVLVRAIFTGCGGKLLGSLDYTYCMYRRYRHPVQHSLLHFCAVGWNVAFRRVRQVCLLVRQFQTGRRCCSSLGIHRKFRRGGICSPEYLNSFKRQMMSAELQPLRTKDIRNVVVL